MFLYFLFIVFFVLIVFKNRRSYYNKRYLKEKKDFVYKAVVIVRASHPTESQIQRFIEWDNSLDDCYKLIVLTDDKSLFILDLDIEVVTAHEVVSKWPELKDQGKKCHNRKDSYYMWSSSHEHIVLWSKKTKLKFKYLWHLEQDLGYSGNINKFLKYYDEYNVDIISLPYGQNRKKTWWNKCYTKEYNDWREKFYEKKNRIQASVFIFRWNHKVLNILYNQFQLKRHTLNEAVIPEITYIFHLSVKIISNKYIGHICVWNGRVNPEEWKDINKSIEKQNKLYHALKF